ncbi:prenylated flavin chaperone LpdD [Lacticaseibacillus sp. GG6-2]
MNDKVFTATQAGYSIQVRLTRQSRDVLLTLTGGDVPHYGVVTTVGQDGIHTHALPSRPGHVHQEGVLTERLAKRIQSVLPGNAIITGGMHVNAITPKQMAAASQMTDALGRQVHDWLVAHPVPPIHEIFAK